MVEDSLNFTNNFVSYIMLPEAVMHFIQHKEIWSNKNLVKILEEHKVVKEMIGNTTKDLDFLPQNRLIFMFQKNIIADTEKITKYHRWFRFANKTKKDDNSKEDFDEFIEDPIFAEMMRRLTIEVLSEEEIKYITDEAEFLEKSKRLEEGMYEVGKKEGLYLSKLIIEEKEETIKEKEETIKEKEETIKEKERAFEAEKKKAEENGQKLIKLIHKLLDIGMTNSQIAEYLDVDETEIHNLLNNLTL
jgi:hypothetical protein